MSSSSPPHTRPSASLRIVLVDPRGDVLFSGESLSVLEGSGLEPAEGVSDGCPETMRSAASGTYRTVERRSHVRHDPDDSPVTEDAPVTEDVQHPKRAERAA
jgi:hypothetical protein